MTAKVTTDEERLAAKERRDRRGGARPGAGRPKKLLTIDLPKDFYRELSALARHMGTPPDQVAANLIMAHIEAARNRNPMDVEWTVESEQ